MKVGMNCLLIILAVIKHPAFGAYFDTTPQLMSRLIDVKEEVRQVEAKYETLYASCSTREATVYVQATSKGDELIKPEDKVVFTLAIVNVGNAYNSETGVFVAPVNGTYCIIATLCATSVYDAYTKFHVVHDMAKLTTGQIGKQIGNQLWGDCENAWAAMYMHKGSEAWVQYGENSNHGEYIWMNTENSFTVVLISKNEEI